MPTLKHGTTTNVRVTKGDEVIFSGRCDVAHGEDGTWSLTPVSLPEEPPKYGVAKTEGLVTLHHMRLHDGTQMLKQYVDQMGNWRTWPEVCALGTPEVLEPDSVKALRAELSDARERAGRYADDANLAESKVEKAETERDAALSTLADVEERAKEWAEKDVSGALGGEALVVTNRHGREILDLLAATEDEPAEPAPVEVTAEPQDEGAQVKDCDDDVWERGKGGQWFRPASPIGFRHPWVTVLRYRPLTLVETGGQS